ncbi:MAG: hybrid sensor histidine kinase/response regulator [Opitutaceae bacterium]
MKAFPNTTEHEVSPAPRRQLGAAAGRLSEELLELLSTAVEQAAIDGILVVDREDRKLYQNSRCIELWKVPSEIAGRTDDREQFGFAAACTTDPARFVARVAYLKSHPAETSRDEIELKDGTVLDRYSAPLMGRNGECNGRIWMFHDITDVKRAQTKLAESLSLLDATLESTVDAILVVDSDGRVTKFNRKFTEMWRIDPAMLAGDHGRALAFVLAQLKDPSGFRRKVEELYAQPDAESFDLIEFRDGRVAERYSRPQRLGESIVGRVWSYRDITERRTLEARLLRTQRMESIGTLAGGIAHDLNNILAPILTSIDLLRLEAGGNEKHLQLLENVRSSAHRGANLVRQVLTFARGLEARRLTVDPRRLVLEFETMIRETFPREIAIVADLPAELWPVPGDPTQLDQVLLNLAVNARDAMPWGGTLTLAAADRMIDRRFARVRPEAKPGPYVVLTVTDTGTGIAPEIRDRIFEPFFTTKEPGKGTGLGLATAHAIVKSHGGFIELASEPGAGTKFEIYLPADPAPTAIPTADPASERPRGRGERILVVDDEPAIRLVTQRTLEAAGYEAIVAGDGAEALARYRPGPIALVLTDMMMPVLNGVGTIVGLRKLDPKVRIVATTGLSDGDRIGEAAALGVRDFLPKPYDAASLLKLVREALDRAN